MTNLATQIRAAVEGGNKSLFTELLSQAADLLDHKDTQINTRPVAPVEGLETVAYVRSNGDVVKFRDGWLFDDTDPLVTRSQAEAIIAAKDAEIVIKRKANDDLSRMVIDLQSDNAALTARVKGLETERYNLAYAITGGEDAPGYLDSLSVETLVEVARDNTRRWFAEIYRAEALETQLAAARKALEKLTLHSNSLALAHVHKTQKNEGIWGALKEARAALEDRP